MRVSEERIPLRDGGWLAATLYLPDEPSRPQPCLVEALPYRKDDLTSSYVESYRSLCDNHGYAVCRIDVRGTGSSPGDALDEYQEAEQRDLPDAFGWLAAQEWCDGQIGMWGTSYSGFNSLQIACERPPELKAICAIYATDDRWTDDVHWRGGALRLVDLVDYCHYMTPMCVLPPVPAVWGDDWYDEWVRRLETNQPWVLTWLRENRHSAYWNHGSVRIDGTASGYERIGCPVMIVAGWADGYRNNSFRAIAELARLGVPHRLLAGPWAHADPATALPGPRIDFEAELVAWFDRWLRGSGEHENRCDVFVRKSTRPEVDLDLHEGSWVTLPSVPPVDPVIVDLDAPRTLEVVPDVGTTAWIDCAGHLPWGLSGDQRLDDARSLTWDLAAPSRPLIGYPTLRIRVSASSRAASLSVKLCDVFPDGTSALVSRGTLDLVFRDDVHGPASPLEPGAVYDLDVVLDACAYSWSPGQTLRVSIAGADWPNTVAPPGPVSLTVHEASLTLPLLSGSFPEPTFDAGAEHSTESPEGVGWEFHHDVLARTTTATTRSDSRYPTPYDGTARELYLGEVAVDTRTFAQRAHADTVYELSWPGIDLTVRSTMTVDVTAASYDVSIWTNADLGGQSISERSWQESIPR
ncbi:MAG TPA: CocE/NonD family hydrolase [Jatrophihabitans sp.]|nr:CocE/NonD family hydrolase [Jatrophihabitans sp.]